MRSDPDEDGWISITSDPVEEKRTSTRAGGSRHGKTGGLRGSRPRTPLPKRPEPVDRYEYQYPPIELFEKTRGGDRPRRTRKS